MMARSGLSAANEFREKAREAALAAEAWRNLRRFMGGRIIGTARMCPEPCVRHGLCGDGSLTRLAERSSAVDGEISRTIFGATGYLTEFPLSRMRKNSRASLGLDGS